MTRTQRFFTRIFIFILRILPQKLTYWIGRRCASVFYWIAPHKRRYVAENLRIIGVPEEDITRTVLKTYESFAGYIIEFFGARYFLPEILKREIKTEGAFDEFQDLMSKGGVILMSAHFSNPYVGTAFFEQLGHRSIAVVLPNHLELTDLVYPDNRDPQLRETVANSRALKRCIHGARDEGKLVTVLADRALTEKGIEIEMFGHKVYLPQGPARMAIHADVPLIWGFIIRESDGTYIARFGPRINPPDHGKPAEKAAEMTKVYARELENAVSEHPEQWHLFYKVFDPPDGVSQDPARVKTTS
jgi:KDO2-lipid IV(A) lauroyltransferase